MVGVISFFIGGFKYHNKINGYKELFNNNVRFFGGSSKNLNGSYYHMYKLCSTYGHICPCWLIPIF